MIRLLALLALDFVKVFISIPAVKMSEKPFVFGILRISNEILHKQHFFHLSTHINKNINSARGRLKQYKGVSHFQTLHYTVKLLCNLAAC